MSTPSPRKLGLALTLILILINFASCGSSTIPSTQKSANAATRSTAQALWHGQLVALSLYASDATKPADAEYSGQVSNFQTNDPSYACLNGALLDVWVLPTHFPNEYVIFAICPNGNKSAWIFH